MYELQLSPIQLSNNFLVDKGKTLLYRYYNSNIIKKREKIPLLLTIDVDQV